MFKSTQYPNYAYKVINGTWKLCIKGTELWEEYQTEDAQLVLVAYGISARICEEVVDIARTKGQKVGLIRPISLYPFPVKAFDKLTSVKAYASVEMSCLSQMIEDVALTVRGKAPVYPIRGGMKVYEASDICSEIDLILAGKALEVF